jgi:DNA-directed RNA polymerase beta subunit
MEYDEDLPWDTTSVRDLLDSASLGNFLFASQNQIVQYDTFIQDRLASVFKDILKFELTVPGTDIKLSISAVNCHPEYPKTTSFECIKNHYMYETNVFTEFQFVLSSIKHGIHETLNESICMGTIPVMVGSIIDRLKEPKKTLETFSWDNELNVNDRNGACDIGGYFIVSKGVLRVVDIQCGFSPGYFPVYRRTDDSNRLCCCCKSIIISGAPIPTSVTLDKTKEWFAVKYSKHMIADIKLCDILTGMGASYDASNGHIVVNDFSYDPSTNELLYDESKETENLKLLTDDLIFRYIRGVFLDLRNCETCETTRDFNSPIPNTSSDHNNVIQWLDDKIGVTHEVECKTWKFKHVFDVHKSVGEISKRRDDVLKLSDAKIIERGFKQCTNKTLSHIDPKELLSKANVLLFMTTKFMRNYINILKNGGELMKPPPLPRFDDETVNGVDSIDSLIYQRGRGLCECMTSRTSKFCFILVKVIKSCIDDLENIKTIKITPYRKRYYDFILEVSKISPKELNLSTLTIIFKKFREMISKGKPFNLSIQLMEVLSVAGSSTQGSTARFFDPNNILRMIVELNKIVSSCSANTANGTSGQRSLDPDDLGRRCPLTTPENKTCGLVNTLTAFCQLSFKNTQEEHDILMFEINQLLKSYANNNNNNNNTENNFNKLYMNGMFMCNIPQKCGFIKDMRLLRYEGRISQTTSISYNTELMLVSIYTNPGRLCRPLLPKENLETFKRVMNKLTSLISNTVACYKSILTRPCKKDQRIYTYLCKHDADIGVPCGFVSKQWLVSIFSHASTPKNCVHLGYPMRFIYIRHFNNNEDDNLEGSFAIDCVKDDDENLDIPLNRLYYDKEKGCCRIIISSPEFVSYWARSFINESEHRKIDERRKRVGGILHGIHWLVKGGILELVDAMEESLNISICMGGNDEDIIDSVTHIELHESMLLGHAAQIAPFPETNPTTRGLFSSNQEQQVIASTYGTTRLASCQKLVKEPLTSTEPIHKPMYGEQSYMGRLYPLGSCVRIAILNDPSGPEDSIILSSSAVERGLGASITRQRYDLACETPNEFFGCPNNITKQVYVQQSDNEENNTSSSSSSSSATPPKKRLACKNLRCPSSYQHLDEDGMPYLGTIIEPGMALIGKYAVGYETNNSESEQMRCCSLFAAATVHGVVAYIHKIYANVPIKQTSSGSPNKEEEEEEEEKKKMVGCSIILEKLEIVTGGDKFTSRCGQKGVVGLIRFFKDMCYNKETGLQPEIIFNTHGLPSRMTGSQFWEPLLGAIAARQRTPVSEKIDPSAFAFTSVCTQTDNAMTRIKTLLKEAGINNYGEVVYVDGETGKELDNLVFEGYIQLQALKHRAAGKSRGSCIAPKNTHNKQLIGGQGRNGALKVGPMEQDAMKSYGVSKAFRNVCVTGSDAEKVRICSVCEYVVGLADEKCYSCERILNEKDLVVEIPYSFLKVARTIRPGTRICFLTKE